MFRIQFSSGELNTTRYIAFAVAGAEKKQIIHLFDMLFVRYIEIMPSDCIRVCFENYRYLMPV